MAALSSNESPSGRRPSDRPNCQTSNRDRDCISVAIGSALKVCSDSSSPLSDHASLYERHGGVEDATTPARFAEVPDFLPVLSELVSFRPRYSGKSSRSGTQNSGHAEAQQNGTGRKQPGPDTGAMSELFVATCFIVDVRFLMGWRHRRKYLHDISDQRCGHNSDPKCLTQE